LAADDRNGPSGNRFTMDLMIFHCDGVLVDSELLSDGLLAEMMSELGHPMTTTCAIRTLPDAA
jgi:beta-phosphoglucomutase-like phosphatase (HAD superfamily)